MQLCLVTTAEQGKSLYAEAAMGYCGTIATGKVHAS